LRYGALLPGYFGSIATLSAALPDMQAATVPAALDLLVAAGGARPGTTYDAMFGSASGPYAEGNNPQALVENLRHTRMFVTSGNGINCPEDPINPNSIAVDIPTEVAINQAQGPFVAAARRVGVDITARTTCGVHTFGVWDRAFAEARAWDLFQPVAENPDEWSYRTVATTGDMWGIEFAFTDPPTEVARFARAGNTLSATGAGEVALTDRDGCARVLSLPFTTSLSDGDGLCGEPAADAGTRTPAPSTSPLGAVTPGGHATPAGPSQLGATGIDVAWRLRLGLALLVLGIGAEQVRRQLR
jgi:hypothetical protein